MGQRDRVTVGGLNRHAFAANRHGSGKRDLAGYRRKDRRSGRRPDVDAAMLTSGVGIVAHGELLQHGAFDRPGPSRRRRHGYERHGAHDDQGSTHLSSPCCPHCQRASRYPWRRMLSIWTTETCRKAASAEDRSAERRFRRPDGEPHRRRRAAPPPRRPRPHPRARPHLQARAPV
jgi:hypothetical protein